MENNTLGDKIRQLRDDQGLGLREFARKVDISAAFLSDIEQGRRYPSDGVLADIAQKLGVKVSELEKHDSRPPIEQLKRIVESDPSYGFALRTLANNPEEILKIAKKINKQNEQDGKNDKN